VHYYGAWSCHPPWRVQRALAPVKALAATLVCHRPAKVFWREEMIGEQVAGALVTGTTPSPSRVQMRHTVAAIKVNRCHMILVICGPE
jgi:hypothetical protein